MTEATSSTHPDELFERLQRAIKRSDIVEIRSALDAGVNPNHSNRHGWTLLMIAALEGNVPIGELLLSRGADPNAANGFPAPPAWQNAVSSAVLGGHVRFLKLLIDHGAATRPADRWLNGYGWDSPKTYQAVKRLLRHSERMPRRRAFWIAPGVLVIATIALVMTLAF